jgi:hypothetical protein
MGYDPKRRTLQTHFEHYEATGRIRTNQLINQLRKQRKIHFLNIQRRRDDRRKTENN